MVTSEAQRAQMRARTAKYRADNKEQISAYARAYHAANKEKIAAKGKARYEANKETQPARDAAYYQANKEKKLAYRKKYYQANKEKLAEHRKVNKGVLAARYKDYCQSNPGKVNAHTAKRKAAKIQRTPNWLTLDDYHAIRTLYETAAALTKATGIKHQVDHILPLRGKTVSGFHCPTNLQILTATENRSKHNKFTGDE